MLGEELEAVGLAEDMAAQRLPEEECTEHSGSEGGLGWLEPHKQGEAWHKMSLEMQAKATSCRAPVVPLIVPIPILRAIGIHGEF